MVPVTYWSMALDTSALFTPVLNFIESTWGWCLSHQKSALSPARRVQCIRDCCPAPMPITWRTWVWKWTLLPTTYFSQCIFCECSPKSIHFYRKKKNLVKKRNTNIFESLKDEGKRLIITIFMFYLFSDIKVWPPIFLKFLEFLDISSEARSYWNLELIRSWGPRDQEPLSSRFLLFGD